MMFWIIFFLIFIPFSLFYPVKTLGKKNFNRKQNYIIICNHQSGFDSVILDIKLRKKIRFIGKIELVNTKFKKYWMQKVLGVIPVDRQKGLNLTVTKEICQIIEDKKQFGLFPEGTRKKDNSDNLGTMKNGACLFAIKTKTPILPCFIEKKQKMFLKNTLLIGTPFELSEFYDKKLDKETLLKAGEILTEQMKNLKENYEKYLKEKEIVKMLKKQKKA